MRSQTLCRLLIVGLSPILGTVSMAVKELAHWQANKDYGLKALKER